MLKLCILSIRILSKLPSKSTKWHFRDSKFKNFLGPSALATPLLKRTSYTTARFCNMSVRKICVFLFVNCVFIYRIANTFVASYAMKYSEISFVTRKFLAYTPPPPNYACLATALAITCLISMYMTNIYVKFLLNAMVSILFLQHFGQLQLLK